MFYARKEQFGCFRSPPKFFQGLGENSCSLQPALKNTAPGL